MTKTFPRLPRPKCLPGKERGVHAGYDAAGELVYIGLDSMVMHREVLDKIDKVWDKVFGDFNADTDK